MSVYDVKKNSDAIDAVATSRANMPHPLPPPPPYSCIQAATLLNLDTSNRVLMDMLCDAALCIKEKIYGRRVVLFAPVYLANYCVNSCRCPHPRKDESVVEWQDCRCGILFIELYLKAFLRRCNVGTVLSVGQIRRCSAVCSPWRNSGKRKPSISRTTVEKRSDVFRHVVTV